MNATYGEITIDTSTLPEASVNALIQRGINHLLGSEANSKARGRVAYAVNPEKPSEASKDAIKVWIKSNADEFASFVTSAQDTFLASLASGSLGVRASSGTVRTVDPVEREMRGLAQAQAMEILRASGAVPAAQKKMPKGDDVFIFGADQLTFAGLVGRVIASGKYGPTLRKQAEAVVRAKQRATEAPAEGAASLADMGL